MKERSMVRRILVVSALIALSACAGVTPAGRNAAHAPALPLPESRPPMAEPAPTPEPAPVAAPNVSVPTPQPAQPANADDDEVVVHGQVENQVRPPNGDPRNRIERMEDIRAWDQCVTHVQSALESDPLRPQLDTPEDVCRQSLGMASRTAVPESRLRRR
jgi:hypothetical protein